MSNLEAFPFANAMATVLLCCMLASLLMIGSQVLIAVAVYNDAQAKQNESPVMWGGALRLAGTDPPDNLSVHSQQSQQAARSLS